MSVDVGVNGLNDEWVVWVGKPCDHRTFPVPKWAFPDRDALERFVASQQPQPRYWVDQPPALPTGGFSWHVHDACVEDRVIAQFLTRVEARQYAAWLNEQADL